MKVSALTKDFFREIKNSPGRFLSILLIIALGVGFFSGFKATAPSMKASAENFFSKNHLFDLEILSPIGFDEDDLKAVKKTNGIENARAGYSVDGLFKNSSGNENVIRVLSLPEKNEDNINTPLITEGRMPKNDTECIFTMSQMYKENFKAIQVGDKITIEQKAGKTNLNGILKQRTYTVCGLAMLPQYISYDMGTSSVGSGTVSAVMMVSGKNFKYPRYTELYLTLKTEGISDFEDAYKQKTDEATKKLEKLGITRLQSFIDQKNNEIIKAEKKLEASKREAKQKLAASEQELNNAEKKIYEGENTLIIGEENYNRLSAKTAARLRSARSNLDSKWAEYNEKKAEYDKSLSSYNKAKQQFDQSKNVYLRSLNTFKEIKSGYDAVKESLTPSQREYFESLLAYAQNKLKGTAAQLDAASAELSANKKQLDAADKKLKHSKILLKAGEAKYVSASKQAKIELASIRKTLNNGKLELENAREAFSLGLAQYNEGVQQAKAKLDNGQNKIINGKKAIDDLQGVKWEVLNRNDALFNYSNFQDDTDRLNAISNIFPVFFLLVAILVCLTTMKRMVDEQRMQIGTLKALGYRSGEIIRKYIFYAGSGGAIGCIVGPVLFISILPKVIYSIYSGTGGLYFLPRFKITIPWMMLGISVLAAMLCTILPAIISCGKELRCQASALMRPKSPKAGKRIFLEKIPFVWNRLSFFRKLTIRNIVRYKQRVLMSVLGIAGGMALMLAGFALYDSVSPLVGLQFSEIEHDDVMMYLSDTRSAEQCTPIKAALKSDKRVADTMALSRNELKAFDPAQTTVVEYTYLIAPTNTRDLKRFFTLRDFKTGKTLSLNNEGVIITKKMSKVLKVKAGDSMVIQLGNNKYTVNITGVADNYTFHYVFMTPAYYKKVTGNELTFNMIYVQESEKMTDKEAFRKEWMDKGSDDFSMIYFISDTKDMLEDILSSLLMVVLVLIVSAGLLTFVVLYCLTNINIEERVREIATVKVLGFNRREVNGYVFRENILITVIAIIVGSVAGYALGQLMISTIEVSQHCFCHEIRLVSYFYSAGLTALFTLLVSLIMSRKIPKIGMVESMKAVE